MIQNLSASQAHRRKHLLTPEGGALPLPRFLVNYDGCYFLGELVPLNPIQKEGHQLASTSLAFEPEVRERDGKDSGAWETSVFPPHAFPLPTPSKSGIYERIIKINSH